MKRTRLLLLTASLFLTGMLCIPSFTAAQTWTFDGGDGTPENPYTLADAADLDAVRNYLSMSFIVMNDIDLTDYLASGGAGYAQWGDAGWQPIINFTGVLDGAGHKIKGLRINRPSLANVGLFGLTNGATIKNLGVEAVEITGAQYVGGLVGNNGYSTIENCYATGNVNGKGSWVGGLVGNNNFSTIKSSFATANVTGMGGDVGGLVGINNGYTSTGIPFRDCYATGNVTGGTGGNTGGLVGFYNGPELILNCYATGMVTGVPVSSGGLVGTGSGGTTYANCFYDIQTTKQIKGIGNLSMPQTGVTGVPTTLMQTQATYPAATWDFTNTWSICEGKTYPFLKWQNIVCDKTLTWTGSVDNDWNNPSNWNPNGVPDANTIVTIPGNAAKFPILIVDPNPPASATAPSDPSAPIDGGDTQPPAPAVASEIHFAPGAELGRQDFLTYDKAFVQLDFNKQGSRSRWWMISNPLQQLFAADFSFGGLPAVAIQEYVTDAVSGSSVWKSLAGTNREIAPGAGFEIWLTDGDILNKTTQSDKGLNASGGIITLPYFETPEEQAVHYTQVYDPTTYKSAYYGNTNFVRNSTQVVSVTRDPAKAYKLVGVDANKMFTGNLIFGKGVPVTAYFAATGNPFMSSISFKQLQQANASMITENYWIWVGAGSNNAIPGSYVAYNITAGTVGTQYAKDYLSDKLPPMQSFIVERNATAIGNQLMFNIASISATGQNAGAGLRAPALSNDLLEMIASTPQASVRAVIASREGGSAVFNPKDSRKMFTEINTLPDLYTLKPDVDKSMVAVAANVLNEIKEDIVIPVGISTTYEGSITFSFAGMDTYNAHIFFIDTEASKSIELTGKAKYEYTFNYAPAKVNGTATSNETRFSIRMSPTNATGIESLPATILVYSRSAGTIQALSGDPILQISVFDIQGREIFGNASVNAHETTVSGLTANVYVVKVVTAGGVKTTKVIVR